MATGPLGPGLDPIAERDRKIAAEHVDGLKFGALAADYIAVQKPSWRSDKTGEELLGLLKRYTYPTLGELPIAAIARQDGFATLQPIWLDVPKSAFRLRALIAAISTTPFPRTTSTRTPPTGGR